jgi:predicted Zn-dependent protease
MSSRDQDAIVEYWNKYIAEIILPHYDFSEGIEKHVRAGRDAEAGKLLETGLQKFPENPELLYYKGLLSLKRGKGKDAYKILKPLKKKYPHHPRLNLTLGEAALASGDRSRAKLHFKAALVDNSGDEKARRLLEEAKKRPPKKPAPEE